MADFHKAFEAIDENGSGEITVSELERYMTKNNYKATFVTKWLKLFDCDNSGIITYKHYCETLGLIPKCRPAEVVTVTETNKDVEEIIERKTTNVEATVVPPSVKTSSKKGRQPKSYPIQSKPKLCRNRKKLFSQHKRRLRASIHPGVVLILLAGRHKGKRVIFLKQLDSGLLLVTGPFRLNGCPLRRVHQKMVIATGTVVNIDGVQLSDHITDSYFAREREQAQSDRDVSSIFFSKKRIYSLKDERKKDQKEVDQQVLAAIRAREDGPSLARYLRSLFSLSSHDSPHKMQF